MQPGGHVDAGDRNLRWSRPPIDEKGFLPCGFDSVKTIQAFDDNAQRLKRTDTYTNPNI